MELSQHLMATREALAAFLRYAAKAGPDAPVPTTPGWDVRHLLAHQGMVHRWATGIVGQHPLADTAAVEDEGLAARDPVEWMHLGALALLEAIRAAPDDLEAITFLHDAPPARRFWARRQCHETTIHAVDALAAWLGRPPRALETWISTDVALDGIDELVTGFLPRRRSRLRSEEELTIAVRPTDADRSWRVRVSAAPPAVERNGDGPADMLLTGSAVALYLSLWNRSEEVGAEGFELWRRLARVSWA